MDSLIIHPTDSGIAVVCPALQSGLSIVEIARKDVPAGVPYRIVPTDNFPDDRTFRDAWTADFSAPDGYGIGAEAWFAEQADASEEANG